MEKTAIIALGGNALSDKSQAGTINDQFSNTRKSLTEIIKFLKEDYNICITHGNGPQVGDELLRMDLTQDEVSPLPCLLYTSPSPRDLTTSRMPSSA